MVTKMKTLLKLLSIAILLIGVNWNASLAEAQNPPNRESMRLFPGRYKCLDLLELQRVEVHPQMGITRSPDIQLATDYHGVTSWLGGFFTAWNYSRDTDGNVTKGASAYQMMTWIFSYCRAHPSEDLVDAAFEFMNAVGGATFKR